VNVDEDSNVDRSDNSNNLHSLVSRLQLQLLRVKVQKDNQLDFWMMSDVDRFEVEGYWRVRRLGLGCFELDWFDDWFEKGEVENEEVDESGEK